MIRLATPVLTEQVLVIMVAFVDQWLAGRYLASPHLAAISLVWYVMWVVPSLFGMVAIGSTALTARLVGSGDRQGAAQVVDQSFAAGGGLCLVAMVLSWRFAGPFVEAMQLEAEAAALALRYFAYLIPIFPAILIQQVGIACLRGAGDTLSGFVAMSVVNIVNAIVGVGLVTGYGPCPNWGWDGLAFATALGNSVGAAIVLVILLRGRAGLRLTRGVLRLDFPLMRRILRVGVPGGVDIFSLTVCHLWFLAIINSLGTLEAAAHGLSVRIESLAYLPGMAFQVSAATMAGQFAGAGDWSRAQRSVWMACGLAGVIMVTAGLVMFFFATPLTLLFLGSQTERVAFVAAPLLQIVACSMPFLALLMVISGALRGLGDTRWMLALTLGGMLLVRIPLAYLFAMDHIELFGVSFPGCGWGVAGAWWAMVGDLVIRSLAVFSRFVHGGWRNVKV